MEQANPGQIKKHVKQLKQREEQYLYYLGQMAFQAGEQGRLEEPGMLEAYRTLKEIQVQVVQWEASLEQMKAAKEAVQKPRCASCGELVKGAVFCPKCGAPVTAPPLMASTAPAPMPPAPAGPVCTVCGAPLDEDAVFCGNCGAPVAQEPASSAPQAQAPQAQAPQAQAPQAQAPEGPAPAAAEAPVPDVAIAPPVSPAPAPAADVEPEPATSEESAQVSKSAAEEPMPSLEETMACPNCGTPIPDQDMRFCPNCGNKARE